MSTGLSGGNSACEAAKYLTLVHRISDLLALESGHTGESFVGVEVVAYINLWRPAFVH